MYIIDADTLIDIFNHYYISRFPTFWSNYNQIVLSGELVSVREVYNEVINHSDDSLTAWSKANRSFFEEANDLEISYVSEIFSIPHFQTLISRRSLLLGKPVADPFIIAKARNKSAIVVTQELYKPNSAKIPNVCEHFGVKYCNLEQFMEYEGWAF